MADRLDGRVAIITGAAGGIGSRLTRAFLNEGAKVTAVDFSEAALTRLVAELAEDGVTREQLMPIETDVSDSQACVNCVQSTLDTFGTVHALVNNAGISMNFVRPDYLTQPVRTSELSPQIWDRIVGVNLSGAWYMCFNVLPHMVDQGYGRIINVTTSYNGMLFVGGQPYGPSKSGLESMSVSHAGEFRDTGVTVNVVVPGGPADTAMIPKEAPFARSDLIDPECMAPPMIWLCAEAGDDVTGRRYIAANWDSDIDFDAAAAACSRPAGWPELNKDFVTPNQH
jgi:NAD(P)-dependent dehydrogenase (short-subunit alcohol dehydrogenase family)